MVLYCVHPCKSYDDRDNKDVELDEKPNKSVLATMQTSLRSKLPPNMIITSDILRLGELIGQGTF